MEEFKHLGIWWLPQNPKKEVGGNLEFSFKSGLRLQLSGTLDDFFEHWDEGEAVKPIGGRHKEYSIIHGLTVGKNKMITLLYCRQSGFSMGMPGIISERISPRFALIGEHFPTVENLNFQKVYIDYSGLSDWIKSSGFQLTIPKKSNGQKLFENYQINYTYPENLNVQIRDLNISIKFNFKAPVAINRKMVLEESTVFCIEKDEPCDIYKWLKDYIFPIRDLFSFATSIPNDIINVFIYADKNKNGVELIFNQKIFGTDTSISHQLGKKLFVYEDLENFDTIFEYWLRLNNDLNEVANLYFNIIYSPELDQQNQFLNIVQAIEIFHRIKFKNHTNRPKDKFDNLKKEIISGISKPYKSFVKGLLKHANEPNLQARLIYLINEKGSSIIPLINDINNFSDRIAKTRNYLIHLNPNIRSDVLFGTDRYWAIQTLILLLQICFLFELGFDNSKVDKFIRRYSEFDRIYQYGKSASYRKD